MKIEAATNSSTTSTSNNNSIKMAFDMYPSISGKQDPVREVVMKYIDYFLPDASGTSAVAIDNKIEQAMDLVKSHLMIAVREEVEVLKEKISELMEKINQLEVENTILKANMSQETLQQLQMQTQLQIAGSGTVPQITAAPTAAATQQQTTNVTAVVAAAATTAVSANNTAAPAATANESTATTAAVPTTVVTPGATTATTDLNVATANTNGAAAAAAITTNGPMP